MILQIKNWKNPFNYFVLEIQPHIQPYAFELNKKLVNSPFINELDQEKYFTYLRSIKKSIELFREENIPIESEIAVLQQKYGMITGQMAVEVNGKTYTLQQASKFFESHDRQLREEVYKKIAERRYQDKDKLNDLFSQLVTKRNQEALNAGFENYRDFKFKQLGRFDYTKEDTFRFHESVKLHVVPLVNKIYAHKKEKLKVDHLRPWDLEAEPEGTEPLTPFQTGKELLRQNNRMFYKASSFLWRLSAQDERNETS